MKLVVGLLLVVVVGVAQASSSSSSSSSSSLSMYKKSVQRRIREAQAKRALLEQQSSSSSSSDELRAQLDRKSAQRALGDSDATHKRWRSHSYGGHYGYHSYGGDCTWEDPDGCESCFHASTRIVYRGVEYTLEQLAAGAAAECHVPHTPTTLGVVVEHTCASREPLRLTPDHLVRTREHGFVEAAQLRAGEHTLFERSVDERHECAVVAVRQETQPQRYFGLNCVGAADVLANGVHTSTFGSFHHVPAAYMRVVGGLLGARRASEWGDALVQSTAAMRRRLWKRERQ